MCQARQMTRVRLSCLKWCGLMTQPGKKKDQPPGTCGPSRNGLSFRSKPIPLREQCYWGICGNGRFCGEPVGEGNVDASLQSSEQTYLLLPDISEPPLSSSGSLCATSSSCTLIVKEHCYHQCDTRGFREIVPSVSESSCVRSQHLWDAPSAENRRAPLGRP